MRLRTMPTLMMLTSTLTLTSACGRRSLAPEPVPLDRVECARCGMLISNESGGGEIVAPDDDTRFYDDVGCLAADAAERSPASRAYVRLGRAVFVEASGAWFAQPADARTPMGSGIVAFRTADEARAADRAGRALSWPDVMRIAGGE